MRDRVALYIDGAWTSPLGGGVIAVENPATEETVATVPEGIAGANNSCYGLAGAVWAADQDRAVAFARQVRTGSIDVNGGAYNPMAPFGGYKQSGLGREMGRFGLEEFTETKSIQL